MDKEQLRKRMLNLREAIGAEGRTRADALIAERLKATPEFERAATVFTYLSMDVEVDTRSLIHDSWKAGKTVAIPRCIPGTRNMAWHVIESFEGLVSGSFGIDEPVDDPSTLIAPEHAHAADSIALVPALSIDPMGYRLGYGGGYYDRFLPTFSGTSIGLCRDAQLSTEPLPTFPTDIPVGIVVTETQTVRIVG